MRLQKYLSECGIASRRKSEQYILDGKIKVNGKVITELGTKVTPEDVVLYMDQPVTPSEENVYIMLHKPDGYVTTAKDQFNRPTVLDLIKDVKTRLYPVGRLDYDTSGLIILTNDGDLTFKLTHPKHNIEKIYIAKLYGTPTEEQLTLFQKGILIDGKKTSPAKIEIIKKDDLFTTVKIAIKEGRNRQVRKMCDAIDHKVAILKRVATGKLYLGDLKKGAYRHLTEKEIRYLKSL